jgi:hypothetical protein
VKHLSESPQTRREPHVEREPLWLSRELDGVPRHRDEHQTSPVGPGGGWQPLARIVVHVVVFQNTIGCHPNTPSRRSVASANIARARLAPKVD